jgi:integrase
LREKSPGRWELRVPLSTDPITGARRQASETFHGTKREAQRELARLVAQADAGGRATGRVTFAQLLDRWWEQKRERLSPTTAREYRRVIERRLKPDLGRRPLNKLTVVDLDAYYLRLERDEGLAPASVRQIHAIVRGALGQAVKWGWLASNPARDATLPRATRQRITPPSAAKVRQLLALAEDHSVEMGMFVRLAALLGARRGEVCGLRWDDVDEASGTIKIRRSVVDVAGHVTVKSTKTHADRVVAVDVGTLDLLRRHRSWMKERALEACTDLVRDAYIVSEWPDGSKPMRPDKVTIVFRALRDKVAVPTARLHDLRHFVATQMIAAGQDVVTVAGRLGHAQPSTTLNIYAAFVKERDREAATQLAALLESPASDE